MYLLWHHVFIFFCSTLYFYCVCIFWISEQFVKCSSWPWTGQYRQGVLNCIDQGPPPTIGGQGSKWLISFYKWSFFKKFLFCSASSTTHFHFYYFFSLGFRMHISTKCLVLLRDFFLPMWRSHHRPLFMTTGRDCWPCEEYIDYRKRLLTAGIVSWLLEETAWIDDDF